MRGNGGRVRSLFRISDFGFRICFGFRVWDFVLIAAILIAPPVTLAAEPNLPLVFRLSATAPEPG
jgi:hypothetical protein